VKTMSMKKNLKNTMIFVFVSVVLFCRVWIKRKRKKLKRVLREFYCFLRGIFWCGNVMCNLDTCWFNDSFLTTWFYHCCVSVMSV
jgi:hypothetical protein